MDYSTIDSEFLKPLVAAWVRKLDLAAQARKPWKEISDECMMFYCNSAKAMYDPELSKRFWSNVKLPKFRVTINKAFEMVAVMGPNLFWEVPHRQVEAKRSLSLPPEFFGITPEMMQVMQEQGQQQGGMPQQMQQFDPVVAQYQQMMQQQASSDKRDKIISYLMDNWLNYTPREQPGGGLAGHSMRSIVDTLIKGRGVTAIRPYKMPGSGRNLTGSFRIAPDDLYLDPDFNSIEECRWMAIKHTEVHWETEKRFGLPAGSLKNKAKLESSWTMGELATDEDTSSNRAAGTTNDLVVWYEIFSKCGVGIRNTTTDPTIRDHMDKVIGQYAYVAICGSLPYPLNMPSDSIRKGATDEDVKQAFEWPVPFWADDRFPIEVLDFYSNPESAWPVAPLAPGLGELKLLNFLVSWFAGRTWKSSRDFWAVAQEHLEQYKEYIMNGEDQSIIPTPVGKSPKECIEILTQPEGRQDMTQLISFVSDMFDKRVGLTPTIYGQNENNTQNRTAEETVSKQRAVNARPEYMQKQVVDWQSRIAQAEAFVTRWFVTGEDVAPLLGPAGAALWDQYIVSTDVELVVRQFGYTVAASSIRRPNRDRDIANFQQVMAQFAPVMQTFGQQTGNYEPFNGLMSEWGRMHDADLDKMMIPGPDPEEQQAQAQAAQQMQQLEAAKTEAEIKKIEAEAQLKGIEAQIKPMESQMEAQQAQAQAQLQMQSQAQAEQMRQQGEQAKMISDLQAKQMELEFKQAESEQKLEQSAMEHVQEMVQDEEAHEQELAQKEEMAKADLESKRAQAAVQRSAAKKSASAKPATKKRPTKKGEQK